MYSPKPRKKFDVELMRSLRAQKKTYREIGAVLNCSEVTVQNYLRLPVADTDEALAAKIAESEAVTENLRAQQRERETRVEIDGDTLDIYGLMEYNPDGSHVVPTTKAQAKRWLRDGGVQKLREALGM